MLDSVWRSIDAQPLNPLAMEMLRVLVEWEYGPDSYGHAEMMRLKRERQYQDKIRLQLENGS